MRIPAFFSRKQLITIGISALILVGSFGLGAYALSDKDAWIKAEIEATNRRIEERAQEWSDTQPKAQRERARCESAESYEARMRELNVANNEDRKHVRFLESLLITDPQ